MVKRGPNKILFSLVALIVFSISYVLFENYFFVKSERLKPGLSPNLVAFIAIGRSETLPTVIHNLGHFVGWTCLVFVYATTAQLPDSTPDMRVLIEKGCSIKRFPGFVWGEFLWKLDLNVTSPYEHIAIVLDDVYIPFRGDRAVSISSLLTDLHRYNLSTISPSIQGGHYAQTKPKNHFCLLQVSKVETFLTIFSHAAWECMYKLLDVKNPSGYCYDAMHGRYCGRVGVNYSQIAYHQELTKVPGAALEPGFVQPNIAHKQTAGQHHLCRAAESSPGRIFTEYNITLGCSRQV